MGRGSIHSAKPHRLVQGRNQASGDSQFKWPFDADLSQRVPGGSRLLTGTICRGWRQRWHREAARVLQQLRTQLLIHQEASDPHHHGEVTSDHTRSVSLGKAGLHLVFACLVFPHFAISDTIIPWFIHSELCAKQMGEPGLNSLCCGSIKCLCHPPKVP